MAKYTDGNGREVEIQIPPPTERVESISLTFDEACDIIETWRLISDTLSDSDIRELLGPNNMRSKFFQAIAHLYIQTSQIMDLQMDIEDGLVSS